MRHILPVLFLTVALPAQAVTATYLYTSGPVTCTSGDCAGTGPSFEGDVFAAILTIEELPGRSLVDASLSFDDLVDPSPPGFAFTVKVPAGGPRDWAGWTVGATFNLTTDADRNILDGVMSIADGPPDYAFGEGFASVFAGDTIWETSVGHWSTLAVVGPELPAAIPIPAGAPLLATALAGLGLGLWRRRSA